MWTDRIRVLDDFSPADWLGARLGGSFGAVTRTVPAGFPAYARILHPASDRTGRPIRWSEVAAVTGRRVHATAQWNALVGPPDALDAPGPGWPEAPPPCGNLPIDSLAELCDLLARHTAAPDDAYFCLWEGWGQLWCGSARFAASFGPGTGAAGAAPSTPAALTADELRAPRVSLPGRDYLLVHGPLSATVDLARYDGDLPWTQSPQLFWPADRAWCVATEVDFDSTLVGGPAELVDAVLRSPDLETWAVRTGDSLACDADLVNRPGP